MRLIRSGTLCAVGLSLVGLSLAGSAAAQSQDVPPGQTARQACAANYRQFCQGVQPGGGRVLACLRQNGDKLSPDCRQALENARARMPNDAPRAGQ